MNYEKIRQDLVAVLPEKITNELKKVNINIDRYHIDEFNDMVYGHFYTIEIFTDCSVNDKLNVLEQTFIMEENLEHYKILLKLVS